MDNTCSTNKERLIKLSLGPIDYSGSAVNYVPTDVKVSSLDEVLKSNNFSPIIWAKNYRLSANFRMAMGFCPDLDGTMTIDEAEAILKKHNLNYVLITSRSHKSDSHHFHVLIPFNRPLYTLERYQAAAQEIGKLLNGKVDPTVFDGARQIYGSPDDAYFSSCWTGNDFDVTQLCGIDLSSVSSGKGDWDDNLVVTGSKGQQIAVNDLKIEADLPIYCPWHDDHTASAFIKYSGVKSANWFIHCSSCKKTYWKTKKPKPPEERCADYWSHMSNIYEVGLVSESFYFKEIGLKKFYTFIDAKTKKEQEEQFEWLVKNHHISCLARIDHMGDARTKASTYRIKKEEGVIEVRYAAIAEEISDNQFIEAYLKGTFGLYTDFIKQYMAIYAYTNYHKLPTLILVGARGVGKSKFAEMVAEIYKPLSEFWSAEQETFNSELTKKLLIADEKVTNDKKSYNYLKSISGQSHHSINEKYTPKHQVKNNINVIILSNKLLPIFAEREELPTSSDNNQFFVFEMKKFTGAIDAKLDEKLKSRLGHYVRTELKRVYDNLDTSKYRYSVAVPITSEERRLFNSSVSMDEELADRFIQEMITRYSDGEPWPFRDFITHQTIPLDAMCKELGISMADKNKIVRNLRENGLLSSERTTRTQFDTERQYCYQMTTKLMDKIELDVKSVLSVRDQPQQQPQKAA